MKAKELREKSTKELIDKLRELRFELFKLNVERFGKRSLKNYGKYRQIKKDIARILTILSERGIKGW